MLRYAHLSSERKKERKEEAIKRRGRLFSPFSEGHSEMYGFLARLFYEWMAALWIFEGPDLFIGCSSTHRLNSSPRNLDIFRIPYPNRVTPQSFACTEHFIMRGGKACQVIRDRSRLFPGFSECHHDTVGFPNACFRPDLATLGTSQPIGLTKDIMMRG